MAKIDVTKIPGYDTMTVEEKCAALEAFEYEDDGDKLRNSLNKANSEAAEYKRLLREKQSEQEKAEADRLEKEKAMQDELAALRKEKTMSAYKVSYLAMGYPEELAKSSAEAMVDGNMDAVFANQKTFMEAHDKALNEEKFKNTPTPPGGSAPTPNYDEMSDEEYYRAIKKK